MSSLVYIVLPVYNGEKYLLQQLMSIYFQDYENWHLVIVNDGSTDSTKLIIDKFILNYKLEDKVTVINQINSGVNKSVERGLMTVSEFTKQSGKTDAYVTFCDADDLLMMNKLSYQINFMENHKKCDLCYHDLILIDENNSTTGLLYLKLLNKNLLTNIKCDKFYEYAISNHIASNTPMFKVDKIEKLLPFPKIFPFHDWRTALIFSGNNFNIVNLEIPLGYYRKYSNGTSESGKKYNYKIYDDFVNALKILKEGIEDNDRMKEIDDYIKYYKDKGEWMKNKNPFLLQRIKTVFKHPKIIMYKLLSYLKK